MKRLPNIRRTACRPVMRVKGMSGNSVGDLIPYPLRDSPVPFYAWLTNRDNCDDILVVRQIIIMCNWMNKKIYIRASKISVIDRGTCFRVVNLVDTQVYAKRQPVKLGILSISSSSIY